MINNNDNVIHFQITIKDESANLANAFEYSQALAPVISSAVSGMLKVTGGDVLHIQGSSLDSTSGGNPTVLIGGKNCTVLNSSATEIFCTTPANPPGKHLLAVTVAGKGLAEHADPMLEYVLELTRVSPNQGSVLGGTVMSLEGSGFVQNASEMHVSIGGKKCHIISSTSNTIKCKASPATKTFNVDNSGRHPCKFIFFLVCFTIYLSSLETQHTQRN